VGISQSLFVVVDRVATERNLYPLFGVDLCHVSLTASYLHFAVEILAGFRIVRDYTGYEPAENFV
jgi:hypothetical protein